MQILRNNILTKCQGGMRNSFLRLFALLSLVMLTACPALGPECVDADEWGQTEDVTVKVDPTKTFSPTGISVMSGEPLEMTFSGLVDLCPVASSFDTTTTTAITPKTSTWQDSGIIVIKDSKLTIQIDSSSTYNDRNGVQNDGRGLYAFIAAPIGNGNYETPPNDEWWYGAQGADQPESQRKFMPGTGDKFFELWDNGTTGAGGSGFSAVSDVQGKLYFRYARTADARGLRQGGDTETEFSPWKGEYRWDSQGRCDACLHATINLTCIAATVFMPICVAAWEGGCAGTGHLQGVGNKCSGQTRASNHWVNENYADNQNGYKITVSSGCPGTFGKYMEMYIGQSAATTRFKTDPAGCTLGTSGCTQVMDNGAPVTEVTYAVTGSVTDVNSSGTKPDGTPQNSLAAGFNSPGSRGHYVGTVPATGEVWFKINDNEISPLHPRGYYQDNTGGYQVRIKTTKYNSGLSDFLNGMIQPIRKVIYGYCRTTNGAPYNPAITQSNCTPASAWQPGLTQRMYSVLVSNSIFVNTIRAAMVLSIIAYSFMFMMGAVQEPHKAFIARVIKFALVIQLFSAGSWQFFNDHLFTFFIDGMNQLIGMVAGDFMGIVSSVVVDPLTGQPIRNAAGATVSTANIYNPFAFIDGTMSRFFNTASLTKLSGLLFASPLGGMYVMLILVGIFYFLYAILSAAILYIICMIAISLLLIVAPIFISFLLFDYTRPYFNNWIKSMMSYLFQPVLVFMALSVFNVFVYSAVYVLLHYRVCWDNVFSISLPLGDLGDISIPVFNFYLPDATSILSAGLPVTLFVILIFILVCDIMHKFVDFVADLAAQLTISNTITSMAKAASGTLAAGLGTMKGAAGLAAQGGISAVSKIKDAVSSDKKKR